MGHTQSRRSTFRSRDQLIEECRLGNLDAVETLFNDASHTNKLEALLAACVKGHLHIIELFASKQVIDLNEQKDGWSALMIASQCGWFKIAEFLLQHGTKVDLQNQFGSTSLMLASQEGHLNIVHLLIANGADIDKKNDDGVTSLVSASSKGHQSIVEILVEKGANVNIRGKNNETALISAIYNGHTGVVKLLHANNAEVDDLVIDIAKKRKNEQIDIERLLLGEANGTTVATVDQTAAPQVTDTMHTVAKVNQIAEQVGLRRKLLDQPFSEDLLVRIAQLIPNWLEYAHPLGLTPQEINGINMNPQLNFSMKTREMLRIWNNKNAYTERAHYRVLAQTSCELELANVAGMICKVLKENARLPQDNNPDIEYITKELKIFTEVSIGGGALGSVFKGELNGEPCAVKILYSLASEIRMRLPTAGLANSDTVERFKQECEYLKSFKHPNIVQHLATKTHPKSGQLVLVLELMDCNLREFFSTEREIMRTIRCQRSLCENVISALVYIHKRQIVHRDLCADNILLVLSENEMNPPIAKISDFGMSKIIEAEGQSVSLPAFGHRGYLPPEVFITDSSQVDSSYDIFQFGVIMLQIVHCLPAINLPKERERELKKVDSLHPFKSLIQDCLKENKSE